MSTRTVLLTGATGLLGGDILVRLLARDPDLRLIVLVREPARWAAFAQARAIDSARVRVIRGDLRAPGLGLDRFARRRLGARIDAVIHAGANTSFSQPLDTARVVNVDGTRRLLELAADAARPLRFAYVSTAFVAGKRTGPIREADDGARLGWVNAYEQSKAEAESLVRMLAADYVIFRPSTIVFDAAADRVRQINAIHRALRLCWNGLAPMLPSAPGATVDVITADYAARAIAGLALRDDVRGATLHLCAGTGALGLEELIELSWRTWSRDPLWRRRTVERPALASLETYRLFEQGVRETGDERMRRVVESLSNFAPQLALPKRFDTRTTDALLGTAAPAVRSYWARMLEDLTATNWRTRIGRAA